jgi:hypothetical protein
MSYAFVQDTPASWETYLEIAAAGGEALPDGLLLHAAGRTDEGFRVISVWESRAGWECFRDDCLSGILEGLGDRIGGQPTFRELTVERLLIPRPPLRFRRPASASRPAARS